MAGEFFGGLGQAFVGGLGCIVTLGLSEDVKRWTEEGGNKVERSAEKAWGKDGEVTQFFESIPGSLFLIHHSLFFHYRLPCLELYKKTGSGEKEGVGRKGPRI